LPLSQSAATELSAIRTARVRTIASALLAVETFGTGFFDITPEVGRFLAAIEARDASCCFI